MRGRALGYREQQVLAFTQATIAEEGIAPSYGMICRELGMSSRTHVHRVIVRLERRGLISRAGAGRVRRIRLVSPFRATVELVEMA